MGSAAKNTTKYWPDTMVLLKGLANIRPVSHRYLRWYDLLTPLQIHLVQHNQSEYGGETCDLDCDLNGGSIAETHIEKLRISATTPK